MVMFGKILDIVYSIYFNFRYLPFKVAKEFPIRVSRHLKIRMLFKGNIVINTDQLSFGMIQLGIGVGSFCLAKMVSTIYVEKDCQLVFNGKTSIDRGFSIAINKGGAINFGENTHLNANNIVSASSLIEFENNVGTGWDCSFIDWDGHDIVDMTSGKVINEPRPILIGENSWIGARATIMKGAILAKNTIVPYGSIITKKCEEPYCIFGGMPNHALKTNIARKDKL